MRLAKPRIMPLQDSELTLEQQERISKSRQKDGSVLNIFRTLVRSPDAFRAFSWWGGYIMARNSLSPRDREIAILRVGWLCKSGYEWTQHHRIALQSGLDAAEIAGQVLEAEKISGERVDNLVVMGMGEPMANFDRIF